MTHSNAIINGNGIELSRIAAHLLNLFTYNLAYLMKMSMTRNKLRKRIDNGNNRFAKLLMFHTCGHPECSGTSHTSAFCTDTTSKLMFHNCLLVIV